VTYEGRLLAGPGRTRTAATRRAVDRHDNARLPQRNQSHRARHRPESVARRSARCNDRRRAPNHVAQTPGRRYAVAAAWSV